MGEFKNFGKMNYSYFDEGTGTSCPAGVATYNVEDLPSRYIDYMEQYSTYNVDELEALRSRYIDYVEQLLKEKKYDEMLNMVEICLAISAAILSTI